MNNFEIGEIVEIISSNRRSDVGAIGRIVFQKNRDIIIKTVGGNMLIKTNSYSIVRFSN